MGSHHLLEALVRAEGSMAAKVLSDLGIDAAAIAAKVDEFDAEDTTDATPEEIAARKMELRVQEKPATRCIWCSATEATRRAREVGRQAGRRPDHRDRPGHRAGSYHCGRRRTSC